MGSLIPMSSWRWRLPFDITVVRHARRLARAATEVGAAQSASDLDHDAAELVVSELVTNAILHGAPPIDLDVDTDDGHHVRIAVSDGYETPLALAKTPTPEQQVGGRGLAIIDAVANQWGWIPIPGGKQVWCEIDSRIG
jgi:anti-sigma regulatory factor (Ser/Thr protein kinase)